MKWCFLINDALFLSEFFGKLANEIIKRGDDCLVVFSSKIAEYEKKKFFPNEVKFISAIDWYINNYEKNKKEFFGLSWKEFFPLFDRGGVAGFNYNKSVEVTAQAAQFFEFIFEKEKPDIIISEVPAGLFHRIAYSFCKKNNSVYLGFGGSRLNHRIDIYNASFTCSKFKKTFEDIKNSTLTAKEKEFARNFASSFISHKCLPPYVGLAKIYFSQTGLIKHLIKRTKDSGPLLFKCFRERKYFKDFDYETWLTLRHTLLAPWRSERRKFRILFQKNVFNNVNNDENFFLFPLQFQPEASTNVCAVYYCDQLNTIKNIAFSIPFPCKLYVKEHPGAVGTKPGSFYKKLKKIPNIVLISPHENVENIIKSSLGVITLTSTIGLEAALAGKPVYVLGDVFYSYHPLCRKMENFEELKEKIKDDLVKKPSIDNLEDINNRFITSYFRNTISGDIPMARAEKDINNYKLIYEDILKILLQKKS